MKRWQRITLWVVAAVVALALIAAAGFVIWGLTPQGPAGPAKAAMSNSGGTSFTEKDGVYYFAPVAKSPTVGVIIYPGGHVDAASYSTLARAIAKKGMLAAVPQMPLSLAFLDVNAADKIMAANPNVKTWILAGHSLGGVAATQFAVKNPDKVDGLVLLASYPAEGTDLSKVEYPVTIVRGTEDGLVSKDDLSGAIPRLPADVTMAELAGGNHAQFGEYGEQRGDGTAKITAREQVDATVEAILYTVKQATGQD